MTSRITKSASQPWLYRPRNFLLNTVASVAKWLLDAKMHQCYLYIPVPALEYSLLGRICSLVVSGPQSSISTAWGREDHKRELSALVFLYQWDISSGFPGIQKARRRTDLWPGMPGSHRHQGLCWPCPQVKVPALQPHQPCQELAPAGTLAAAKQRAHARLVPALSPCGRCCLAEAFCEEGGDDVLFRRQVASFSFHLKDSLKCGGY